MYTNPTQVLVDIAKYPAAIEAKLPAGAPPLSTMMVDAAGKLPVVPDFPMGIPELPAVPELPSMPALPGGLNMRRYVTGVEVVPQPAGGGGSSARVDPSKEIIPLVFE